MGLPNGVKRAVLPAALAGAALGLGIEASVGAAWDTVGTSANATEYCPVGSTSPVTSPIELNVVNGEPVDSGKTDFVADGIYNGQDVDFRVKTVSPEGVVSYGEVSETLAVKAGETAVAQIVGATYAPGEKVNLTLKWARDKSVHPLTVAVDLESGAPCETPIGETPKTENPTPVPGNTAPAPVEVAKPVRPKTPELKNNSPILEVTKTDITDRTYTKNGRVVLRYGKPVGHVAPNEEFVTEIVGESKNDGDKFKNEVQRNVKLVVTFPNAKNGEPGELGYNPKTERWVSRMVRTVPRLVEGGKPVEWDIRTKTTEAAAQPPQVLCNQVAGWFRGRIFDRDAACVFDPFNVSNSSSARTGVIVASGNPIVR